MTWPQDGDQQRARLNQANGLTSKTAGPLSRLKNTPRLFTCDHDRELRKQVARLERALIMLDVNPDKAFEQAHGLRGGPRTLLAAAYQAIGHALVQLAAEEGTNAERRTRAAESLCWALASLYQAREVLLNPGGHREPIGNPTRAVRKREL